MNVSAELANSRQSLFRLNSIAYILSKEKPFDFDSVQETKIDFARGSGP